MRTALKNEKKLIFILFFFSLCLILWLGIANYHNNQELIRSGQWVSHTNQVIGLSEKLISLMKDNESGRRGYLLTGDQKYLAPFYLSYQHANSVYDSLVRLSGNNVPQQRALRVIKTMVDSTLNWSRALVLDFEHKKIIPLKELDKGRLMMVRLRHKVNAFQQTEKKLLQLRQDQLNKNYQWSTCLHLSGTGLSLLLLCLSFTMLIKKLIKEGNYIDLLEKQVQDHVQFNKDLAMLNEELCASNEEVSAYNEQLSNQLDELNRTGQELKKLLNEKEVLLKEVYHRVKNNIGIVTGLLQVQMEQTDNLTLKELLHITLDRITVILLTQEKLYKSPNLACINLETYLLGLLRQLCISYGISDEETDIRCDIMPVQLEVDIINTLGLIVNELITNIFKHAYPQPQHKIIELFFGAQPSGFYRLLVRDNGVGLAAKTASAPGNSMGQELVEMLAGQINGVVNIISNQPRGLEISISFAGFEKYMR